ncbi:Putative heterokaryon incompatibility [Colletotrichum destructivum]|uniref:Heterokaryon incompatibility n=1 Tax=Colletotrichum destructivum TaxID=34406 RepID=A0AAX4J1S1_9PEZI|nr:Putative heterokaryon incompatibility [Colletotrichum destructivum]
MSVMPNGTEVAKKPRPIPPRPLMDSGSEQRRRDNKDLCEVCRSLDLGVHSFKVQSGSPGGSGGSGGGQSSSRPLHSSTTARRLGTLHEIKARSTTCALCALVVKSVDETGTQKPADQPLGEKAETRLQGATCLISWEIDGREAAASTRNPGHSPKNLVRGITRRMHIRWDHPRLSDAYLVYVAPETFSRTTSDADRVWAKGSLFLGRAITENIENQALIQSWLDLCRKTHRGPCCQIQDGRVERFIEMISHSYFGVIDVQNMQLTQLPCQSLPGPRAFRHAPYYETLEQVNPEPYVALSYVWGAGAGAYTTLTENVMLHRTHGGLEEVLQKLPRAIQDAIDLVRRLGFRYVWIDRLCIVQNSARSWKLNAYNMDLIYGNAELTICAADGDATKGLCAMRPATRNTRQIKGHINSQLQLMVTRPPEMYIRASEWNERAWTFQERLLSRRCLIFTNGRVYFQCRSTGMSEDIFGDKRGAGWSLDLVDAPLQMFRQLESRSVWVYMKCVELYTERKLTQAKDIQAAFSGMANLMEERMRAPFVHGLPSSHFDLALLWEPIHSSKRRVLKETPENASIPDFPSWSWTGWTGEVKYKEDLMSGVLDGVSDWLDTRTWIEWWVRDGHGDLRPLWDYRMSEEDTSKDVKWRGYTRNRAAARNERPRRQRDDYEYDIDATNAYGPRDAVIPSRGRNPSPPRLVRRSFLSDDDKFKQNNNDDSYDDSDRFSGASQGEAGEVYVSDRYLTGGVPPPQKEARFADGPDPRPAPLAPFPYPPPPPGPHHLRPLSPYRPQPPPPPPPRPRFRTGQDHDPYATERIYSRYYRNTPIITQPYAASLPLPVDGTTARQSIFPPRASRRNASPPPPAPAPVHSEHPTHNADFFDMFFDGGDKDFNITLRDYPYRVVKAPFDPRPQTAEYPLLPILQFRTWHTWLYIRASTPPEQKHDDGDDDDDDDHSRRTSMGLGAGGQVRHHIADEGGDWCGSIMLDAEWAAKADARQEFIAVSEAKSFTEAECQEWTYYVPKERDQSEWDLFYVLLIERKDERWERIGVGKVFKEAFRGLKQREIMLS